MSTGLLKRSGKIACNAFSGFGYYEAKITKQFGDNTENLYMNYWANKRDPNERTQKFAFPQHVLDNFQSLVGKKFLDLTGADGDVHSDVQRDLYIFCSALQSKNFGVFDHLMYFAPNDPLVDSEGNNVLDKGKQVYSFPNLGKGIPPTKVVEYFAEAERNGVDWVEYFSSLYIKSIVPSTDNLSAIIKLGSSVFPDNFHTSTLFYEPIPQKAMDVIVLMVNLENLGYFDIENIYTTVTKRALQPNFPGNHSGIFGKICGLDGGFVCGGGEHLEEYERQIMATIHSENPNLMDSDCVVTIGGESKTDTNILKVASRTLTEEVTTKLGETIKSYKKYNGLDNRPQRDERYWEFEFEFEGQLYVFGYKRHSETSLVTAVVVGQFEEMIASLGKHEDKEEVGVSKIVKFTDVYENFATEKGHYPASFPSHRYLVERIRAKLPDIMTKTLGMIGSAKLQELK